ncbi:hypothetical protein CSC2_35970 [Clostridium zeae]|uniref:Radical SAM core domain-containing protein n=1 Tax=Clostridium zeae TaxID=2759022 RepID=A0ABQ1EE80_9CLOT|nr:radical SAM peptide maturase, CXXX-repeat target family [Clostridium zeae]GFZ33071.1 hypothetical protein CSC2_35970 [Clostridium zeae]
MEYRKIKMGEMPQPWGEGLAKTITFCVTENCNLACKYCYMTGKNTKNKMDFEVAKKAVDYILENREFFDDEGVIWDFIGGEPFLEIDLIDKISDYIKYEMFKLDHPWFNNYRFNFSTNGVLYHTPKVQQYIRKNKGHLSIGISIDGNKIKHDLQRVKVDGTGSYDDVLKNIPLWMQQFPSATTKATFSHGDLKYIKDSIISLWNLGLKIIPANVVFEDVWHEGDDEIFEQQLKELADYIIENKLWEDHSVRFFGPNIGLPLEKKELEKNFCGAGTMLAIDWKGNFFPCVRFCDISLSQKKGKVIGDIYNGINEDKLRPFAALSTKIQSKEECLECEVASGCAWCNGFNYDIADTDTIFQRATNICKMHKANVRANDYFWDRLSKELNQFTIRDSYKQERGLKNKNLLFITSDNITPHCSYRNTKNTNNVMTNDVLKKGMEFCKNNNIKPVFLAKDKVSICGEYIGNLTVSDQSISDLPVDSVSLLDNSVSSNVTDNCILLINEEKISKIYELVSELKKSTSRVNLILEDIMTWQEADVKNYELQLDLLLPLVADSYNNNEHLSINVLTDIFEIDDMHNCDAGESTFALAPNGRIYICPAFYFNDPEDFIGTLEDGINIKNKKFLSLENAPICLKCDAYQCRRCKFQNKIMTDEINIPSKIQCIISHVERNKSKELKKLIEIKELGGINKDIIDVPYLDPISIFKNENRRPEYV